MIWTERCLQLRNSSNINMFLPRVVIAYPIFSSCCVRGVDDGREESRVVWSVIAVMFFLGVAVAAAERRVPEDNPSIQAAVDAAGGGDLILVAPGTYHETITIKQKKNIILRGDVDLKFSETEPCWDTVSHPVLDVVLSGSIYVISSNRITIERLTVSGPGPGIQVEGTPEAHATDISVRYCNLLCNEGGAIELVDHFRRVSVMCSNACLSGGRTQLLESNTLPHQADIHVTCTASFFRSQGSAPGLNNLGEVIVAVIDSGIDRTIPSLGCRMYRNPDELPDNGIDDDGNGYVDDVYGWDFRDEDPDSLSGSKLHWHGTFVAGVIAGTFDSPTTMDRGTPGVKIMDLRLLDSKALFYTSDWPKLVRAIDYAVANGARIINLSVYASKGPPRSVREAILRALQSGVLVVGIAGNDSAELGPIANWEEVLTIGAVDREGQPALFSNVGPELDLASLGVGVLSFLPGGLLGTASGTSFAAPRVAGLAALHLSERPNLSPEEVKELLKQSASDVHVPGKDPETGWGVI